MKETDEYRDEISTTVINSTDSNILIEFPTSFGKSKLAIEIIKKRFKKDNNILIVIPKNILRNNWIDEFKKWKYEEVIPYITFVTYTSFPKIKNKFTFVIFDEAHHLSNRCLHYFNKKLFSNTILLSATIKKEKIHDIKYVLGSLKNYSITTKEAIDNGVLPDPTVYLIPLMLNNTANDCMIIKNKTKNNPILIDYKDRWKYSKVKDRKVIINCTQEEYYMEMNSLIYWYKQKSYSEKFKKIWFRKCRERIAWLSDLKTEFVYNLLQRLKDYRTITFCNSIKQAELLSKNCISSKNKEYTKVIKDFNAKKINDISSVIMLDEGANLVDCRVGVYAVLRPSDRIITQRMGRLLRHKEPILILPYYVGTRDEEIINKMKEDYNPSLIKTLNIKDLKL